MKKLHIIVGLTVVVIFLLTGQYMEFHKVAEVESGTRMMFRSRHIYILLAGLVNLGIGTYFTYRSPGWRRVLQIIGSVLVIAAPFGMIGAFFREPMVEGLQRFLTLPSIIGITVGALLGWIGGVGKTIGPRD